MKREFVYTKPFLACWKAMGLNNNDLINLESLLLENPLTGDLIQDTG